MNALRQLSRSRALLGATPARAFSTTAPNAMAKLTLIGRLTQTPEVTIASTGREYLTYSVATNSGPAENRKTHFWNVSCFVDGPQKDYVANLPKGALVYFEGDCQNNTYQDDEGKNRRSMNIVHRNISLLSRPQPKEDESS